VQTQGTALCKEGNVLLSYPTGFGKTKTVCNAIPTLVLDGEPIYFVTSRLPLIKNTKKDFAKYGLDYEKLGVEFLCYQSLHKLTKRGKFILDEVHNLTENYVSYIKPLTTNSIVLTATLPKSKAPLLKEIGVTRAQVVTLKQAIEKGVLPKPKLYWHPIYLDNTEKKYTLTRFTGKGKPKKTTPKVELPYSTKNYWSKDYPDTLLLFRLTAKEYYSHIDKEVAYYQKQANNPSKPYAKNIFNQKALKRKEWLSDYKFPILCKKVEESTCNKILVYLQNISQCEKLDYPSFHSKNTNKTNDLNLEKLIEGETKILTSVNSLKEGQNIPDIEEAFILQLDNVKDKPHSFIQTVGRALRGTNPVIHVFYVPESQDENYFLKTFNSWL